MKIYVRLHGIEADGRFRPANAFEMEIDAGSDIETCVNNLGFDSHAGLIVAINGAIAKKGQVLSAGDHLSLFPPIGGG